MRDGDLVLIDAGCEYKGYAGDITRTFPVNGKFTQAQREIYDIVLESLETSLDLVLIDAGCEYKGYAGDITRTFPVNGKFTQAQREIYDIVLESLETSLRLYRPGTSMQEVTGEVVRIMVSGLVKLGILKGDVDELIAQNAHRPFFMHGLSHWLGLDVHDVGVYGQDRSRILEPGMVLTVEPGLYIAPDAEVPEQYRGIGIRIEDDIVITETGNENLTASVVKKPEEIEALMAAARKQIARAFWNRGWY